MTGVSFFGLFDLDGLLRFSGVLFAGGSTYELLSSDSITSKISDFLILADVCVTVAILIVPGLA